MAHKEPRYAGPCSLKSVNEGVRQTMHLLPERDMLLMKNEGSQDEELGREYFHTQNSNQGKKMDPE